MNGFATVTFTSVIFKRGYNQMAYICHLVLIPLKIYKINFFLETNKFYDGESNKPIFLCIFMSIIRAKKG